MGRSKCAFHPQRGCADSQGKDSKRVSCSVSVFGLGYVGSVSAACFVSMRHRVVGVDVSRAKVEMMESGRSPIIEARMSEMVMEGHNACRLHATTDPQQAIRESEIS